MGFLMLLILTLLAGVMNGSFALPTKSMKQWHFENTWLIFVVFAFAILPWLIVFIVDPHAVAVYAQTPSNLLHVMLLTGILFGVGQLCFALALNMIGLGLGFVINIGLGTGLGFLAPLILFHPDEIFSTLGVVTLIGTLLIIIGLILSFRAGKLRSGDKATGDKKKYYVGVILAIIAGLSSAAQNVGFASTAPMQQLALKMGITPLIAANIIWPGFLVCGFIPYALYLLFLLAKNKTFTAFSAKHTGKYWFYAFIMAFFWYVSLLVYSKSSMLIGSLGPVVAWPLFMVAIILTSNFWGWRSGEWTHAMPHAKKLALRGILSLVFAVIVLAYSLFLSHG